jgi:hypothetical protein
MATVTNEHLPVVLIRGLGGMAYLHRVSPPDEPGHRPTRALDGARVYDSAGLNIP